MRGRGQASPDSSSALPSIPGYQVSWGRVLLHARYAGTVAEAHQQGRPWHVVAHDPAELMRRVGRVTRAREDR
jgi:hypothetical protein